MDTPRLGSRTSPPSTSRLQLTNIAAAATLVDFKFFQELPKEIREKVWKLALSSNRGSRLISPHFLSKSFATPATLHAPRIPNSWPQNILLVQYPRGFLNSNRSVSIPTSTSSASLAASSSVVSPPWRTISTSLKEPMPSTSRLKTRFGMALLGSDTVLTRLWSS
jgi:hypothetical protein